jgi:two-component system response regulator YesN
MMEIQVRKMYKLLLVDDEEEVRKGIVKKINWQEYGFEISGEAENGREALDLAEKLNPDLVLTDIKMPFMNGLELAEVLKKSCPTTKVIIITGFDDFDYARKAIGLNVIEYILKPVSSQDLITLLKKVKIQLDEEFSQKENINNLQNHYFNSLPILREKLLTSLITGQLKKDELLAKAKSYNIDIEGNLFLISVIHIDKRSEILFEKRELLNLALMDSLTEAFAKNQRASIFIHNERVIIISVFDDATDDIAMHDTGIALEETRICVEKYLKITITAGIGTFCRDITQIVSSYQNAMAALDYRFVLGNNRIICIEDLEPQAANKIIFTETNEHDLNTCIKVGNEKNLLDTIDGLFSDIIETKASYKDYQVYLLEMLTTIVKTAKQLDVDMIHLFGENYNIFSELYKHNDIKDVKRWLYHICTTVMKHISNDRLDSTKSLMEQAKVFAQEHYRESDITINMVCKNLHISSTYFSALFKKETKMTFMSYLFQIRMDAAKDLLKNTNLKAFEISEKVGYSEPNYFSYCFKKQFGVSPSEYRSSVKPDSVVKV